MVVYVDILILINFVVDYFLILISAKFLNIKPRFWRLVLSALVGGIFSLYIFLPQNKLVFQFAVQFLMSASLCFITFGFIDVKNFIKNTLVLFCVNFAYSGAMIALWLVAKPYGMVINNSVVYFNISPLFLILFSVVGYFVVIILRKILKKPFASSAYCTVEVICLEKSLFLSGIADTGNSITDVFGFSEIFITDKDAVEKILAEEKENPSRFRKIPCSTITGQNLLDGYRIDLAIVDFNNKKYEFKNPILAVSTTPLNDCQIIVNPEKLI